MSSKSDPNAMAIAPMAIARLRPCPGNARTHSKKQIRQIADSIQKFGFINPVLISDDDEIIAGHGRVEAAKLLGMESVPTLRLSHLDAAQRRAYVGIPKPDVTDAVCDLRRPAAPRHCHCHRHDDCRSTRLLEEHATAPHAPETRSPDLPPTTTALLPAE